MYWIRFWALALVSFITAIVATLFVPGAFWNRVLSVAYCTIFSFNSTFCAANLGRSPERVIAANPPAIEKALSNIHSDFSERQLTNSDKKVNSLVAFKPSCKQGGHLRITTEAIQAISKKVDGNSLTFSEDALAEILQANKDTDCLTCQLDTSKHFDDEDFEGGTNRLLNLKVRIINSITNPSPDCGSALKDLGSALHTIQDFYSHTNWVELGKTEIDRRLGRNIIRRMPENIASCPDNPAVLGGAGLRELTSGYFRVNTPSGKCRHGAILSGINKDTPPGDDDPDQYREAHETATRLASEASVDFIKQIIDEDPRVNQNPQAIKALMNCPIKNPKREDFKDCLKVKPKGNYKQGKSYGDPHLITFDGLNYSFQTVGEFILVKSNNGKFEVQVRHAPVNSSLSLNNAVAIKVNSDRVAFYSKEFPDSNTSTPLRINGKPTVIQGDSLSLPGGNTIAKSGDTYVVNLSTGEKVVVDTAQFGNNFYFNVSPFVLDSQPERYSGLLGNVNGNPKDDQKIRGGSALSSKSTYGDVKQVLNLVGVGQLPFSLDGAEKVYFDQLYKDFANSWRISQKESLFDYLPNKTTENYTDRKFPDKYLKLEMLSPKQIEKARSACEAAKVTQDMMEGCIFDVGFTGFSEFARTTAEINGYVETLNKLFPSLNIPTSQRVIDNTIDRVKPKVCLPFVGCL